MTRPHAALAALFAGLVLHGCARGPERPDILLVSIERFDWSSLDPGGDGPAPPRLGAFARGATQFRGLVSPTPGGAPAALTLLSGLEPAAHRLRRHEGAPRALHVPTLGDEFTRAGWTVGAFSQAPLFAGRSDLAAGFEAWMMPNEALPLGLPAFRSIEAASTTAAHAGHWLSGLPANEPALAWVHFEAPALPAASEGERAAALAELDSLLGQLIDRVEQRSALRGARAVVVVTSLSSTGADVAAGLDAAFLLEDSALRVRALAQAPGLAPGVVGGLAGLDEVQALLRSVAEPGEPSRLRELAAGTAVAREAVIVETQLPMTSLGALPSKRAVRALGARSPQPDPLSVDARAGDPGWPGGFVGPSASEVLPEWHELLAALAELSAGEASAARARLERLVAEAGPRAHAAVLLLALSEASSGDVEAARGRLGALAADLPLAAPAHRQAVLALAEVERLAGRPQRARELLQDLTGQDGDDLAALLLLGTACEQTGDVAAALATLSRALESRPRDARVLRAVARVQSVAGRPDLAAAALADALRQRPVDGSLLLAAADAFLAAGDSWTALELLDRHQKVFGTSAETTERMALVYHGEGLWANALALHGRALDLDVDHEPARLALGDALLRSGQEADGRSILTVAAFRSPRQTGACGVLVRWLVDEGRGEEARAEWESCLAQHPGDAALMSLAAAVGEP